MAELPTFRCTLCTPDLVSDQNKPFGSQEALNDHLALHALVTSGKLFMSYIGFIFRCCECCDMQKESEQLNTHALALAHLKMHEELKKVSKALAFLNFAYDISGSKVYCAGCSKLNKEIDRTTIGDRQDTKKDLFDSASEFVEHFLSEHMQCCPYAIERVWSSGVENSDRIKVKQCSFCGTLYYETMLNSKSFWEHHICQCDYLTVHEMVQQEIAVKKAIASLLVCYKLSKKDNCLCCLSPVDDHVVNKIVKRMLL